MSPVDLAGRGHHRDGIGVRCVILGDGPWRPDRRCGCNPLPVGRALTDSGPPPV
jgi:hypothetical protein